MAQISNCLKLLSKIDERDQDALVARLDELQAQGVPAERAQIQAAIDVLTAVQGENSPLVRSITREQALETNVRTEMPTDPVFEEAVANTTGARVDDEGLHMRLMRWQKPEQEAGRAIRTGVFYLPDGSSNSRHYRSSPSADDKQSYGGSVKMDGETLIRRPLFVRGATGGKAPESAYDAIKGKGAMKKLDSDVFGVINERNWMTRQGGDDLYLERVRNLLRDHGADPQLASDIIRYSRQGNQLRYALQENIIAHTVRAAGYDAVVGYSKGKAGAFISEVFDVREQTFPSNIMESDVHKDFLASATRSASRLPVGVEIVEVEDGFDAMKDGKRIGRLRDNLPRGAAEQLDENASVDIVKVDPEFKGQGVGSALYEAFNEKHGGRIAPSGKTSPEAWALWKRKYPEKVDAFVAAEAGRIADGADQSMVIRNITDPEVARRVAEAAPEIALRSATRPEFFSQLQRSIEGVPDRLATMAAPQWKLWLDANAPKLGVKKDEIEWSGVKDYLDLRGKDKVARDDLVAYLGDSGVRIEETVLGSTGLRDTGEMYVGEANDYGDEWAVFTEDGSIIGGTYESEGAAEQAMDQMNTEGKPTKYGSYTVPGGENYREVLITLPDRAISVAERPSAKAAFESEMKTKYGGQTFPSVYGKLTPSEIDKYEMLVREDRNSEKTDRVVADRAVNYKSSHWDQPNILAHLRVDDRTDADGNKVLFVHELQSDFGQDYRKAKDAIDKAVNEDFQGIVDRMKKAGVLEVVCD